MENKEEKITRDQLLFKEFIALLVLLVFCCWLAIWFPAPLSQPGGEMLPPGVTVHAPWIFAGLQTLLLYFHPLVAGLVFPLVVILFLVLLPLEGKTRLHPDLTRILFALLLLGGAVLTFYGLFRGR
jgi:hypothetical protein